MNGQLTFSDAAAFRLADSSSPSLRCYLIVDQAALRQIDIARELRWSASPIDLLTRRPVDWTQGASPVMLPAPESTVVEPAHLLAWRRVAERCRYSNAMTLLTSEFAVDELASALEQRMKVRLEGNLEVLLRWFDGRVMDSLLAVLQDSQKEAFLAPCREWVWQSRDGTARVDRSTVDPPYSGAGFTLVLSQAQETALVDMAEVDLIVDVLLNQGSTELAECTPAQQHSRVAKLLRAARAYGIDQVPDQTAYCAIGLRLGNEFHADSPWAEMLAECAQRGRRFGEMLSELSRDSA